jgi:hypothetical protein
MIHSKQGASSKGMMDSEISPHFVEEATKAPIRRDLIAGSRPKPIVPKSLSEAYRIAKAVCAANMAPKGLDTPEACMIAIMHGLELGLSPMSALQRIAVINGRPTIWGDGALAIVKASGLCEAIEEWIEGDRPETWMAVCNVMRRGDIIPTERRFSFEDAKRAKLWGKTGPWSDYPKRMLQMRARAFALRDAFPDVLGGLYLTEEWLQHRNDEGADNQTFNTHSDTAHDEYNQAKNTKESFSFEDDVVQNDDCDDYEIKISSHKVEDNINISDYKASTTHPANIGDPISHGIINEKMPPIANLRRSRRMPRSSLSLRFKRQWSIKQPKEKACSEAIKQKWDLDARAVRDKGKPNIINNNQGDIENHSFVHSFVPDGEWEANLEFFDAALCCANDRESLIEIAEEFSDRLKYLPNQAKAKSDKIFEKHVFRIEHGFPENVLHEHNFRDPIDVQKQSLDEGGTSSISVSKSDLT